MSGITTPLPSGSAPVVLVVDDLALVREMLRAVLRFHGFQVRLAGDGREAIELYRRDHDTIALVLLDVQMPGLDGPEVLTALRTIEPDVRAFFMTGNAGPYVEDELLATGARRVFAKPLDISAVVAELRQSLGGWEEGSPRRRTEPDRPRPHHENGSESELVLLSPGPAEEAPA
jgi:CheY-like chemotaxis protein